MNIETKEADTEAAGILKLPGLHLLVVRCERRQYVAAKPLTRWAKVDWKRAKQIISAPERADLYSTVRLKTPEIDGQGGHMSPPSKANLYIAVGAVEAYIMRINTTRMRAQGNVDGADWVLAKQKEWRDALHAYERDGFAAKPGFLRDIAKLVNACKALSGIEDARQRMAARAAVEMAFAEMGIPMPVDPQLALPLSQQGAQA